MAGTQGHIIDDARKRVVIRSDRVAIIAPGAVMRTTTPTREREDAAGRGSGRGGGILG